MERIDDDHYSLSSGREFYACRGIIGLDPDGPYVYEGSDGELHDEADNFHADHYGTAPDHDDRWTPEERRELADFMIAAWQRYKGSIK